VDDREENLALLQSFLAHGGFDDLRTTTSPRHALEIFDRWAPDIVLLDLHMNPMSGFDVLIELRRRSARHEFLPVVVLTADTGTESRLRALELGATDFLTKPLNLMEVNLRVRNLLDARRAYVELASYRSGLEVLVAERTNQLEAAQREIVEKLALAAEYRDDETGMHTRRVGDLAAAISIHLGLPTSEVELIHLATPLHDIGKIAIPDRILLKPGKLTVEEYEEVKQHVSVGASILRGSRSPILQMAAVVALAHHERWDGSGYAGLAGESIPRVARIVAVADVYDALVNERPYKRAWRKEEAIAEMRSLRGSHFDPDVLDAFLDLIDTGQA
jgi:putative two-component system response regulator